MELLNCAEKLPDGAQIKIDALAPPLKPESENNGYNLQLERFFCCKIVKDCCEMVKATSKLYFNKGLFIFLV